MLLLLHRSSALFVKRRRHLRTERAREDRQSCSGVARLVVSTDLFGDTVPPDGLDCLHGAGEAVPPNVARASYRGLVNKDISV